MKVSLFMVMSADGVAAKDERTDIRAWSSDEDHRYFLTEAAKYDAAIMGSHSYNPEVVCGRKYILSHRPDFETHGESEVVLSGEIAEIYRKIEADGIQRAALLGGPSINDQFLRSGLVDDIFLTIEPVLLGSGMRLAAGELVSDWYLANTRRLNAKGTIVMHYVRERSVPESAGTQGRWRGILTHPKYTDILTKLERLEQDRVFCKHDLQHFLDTARIMYLEVLERGLPFSMDMVYGAGLLHDIGRYWQYKEGLPHETAGAETIAAILTQCAYSEAEISMILEAIAAHRDEQEPEGRTSLGGLLYHADKLGRCCFRCTAAPECNWPDKRKNSSLIY